MKIIGITGPIGAGKSYVADIMARHGIPCLDTDEIYHELVEAPSECTVRIQECFGDAVMNADGSVNRPKLAEIVFSDKQKLAELNKISHACVSEKTEELLSDLENRGETAVLIEVPIMFESRFNEKCDAVICVTADTDVRIERIRERSGLSEEEAKKRIANQKSPEFYINNSDFTVYNNGSEDLNEQIDRIFAKILR